MLRLRPAVGLRQEAGKHVQLPRRPEDRGERRRAPVADGDRVDVGEVEPVAIQQLVDLALGESCRLERLPSDLGELSLIGLLLPAQALQLAQRRDHLQVGLARHVDEEPWLLRAAQERLAGLENLVVGAGANDKVSAAATNGHLSCGRPPRLASSRHERLEPTAARRERGRTTQEHRARSAPRQRDDP